MSGVNIGSDVRRAVVPNTLSTSPRLPKICHLFAQPLVRRKVDHDRDASYVPEEIGIDSIRERKILYHAIEEAWRESKRHTIEFESKVADNSTLKQILKSEVTVFHYSGYDELTDQGSLSITTEQRAVHRAMRLPEGIASIEPSKLPKIAVLSSSRDVDLLALGKQLVDAGISHVVILKANLELIKWFSYTFYNQLLAGECVNAAFDDACTACEYDVVNAAFDDACTACEYDVEDTVRLFPLDGNHNVSYFSSMPLIDGQSGEFEYQSKIVNWCPKAFSNYEMFVGRNLALHTAYKHLLGMIV